ncbi:RDD family protein [Subsaxibacter sp. CAU 1640]|uniref:RDD family protein n=1 Tax=Subsaxibacter sp. CAU 1640 TaxID=2933271 RepID=UPI002004BAC9|nr:RDD family protein [Subsaxibacter sp. CAU 1640]MCK7591591.1 RDD family protein [Subsaxibacter sp. CAU 1640]
MKDIDKSVRLANYLVDLLVILICYMVWMTLFDLYRMEGVVFYAIMFVYYLLFEALSGQTLGKKLTKTKVVLRDGTKPSFFRIVMRSILRIIPFDGVSYLFGYEIGLHDLLSSTKLSKEENSSTI